MTAPAVQVLALETFQVRASLETNADPQANKLDEEAAVVAFLEAEASRSCRTISSPSRVRFRPLSRSTFPFRVLPPGGASTYSRPVLGASGTLPSAQGARKRGRERFL